MSITSRYACLGAACVFSVVYYKSRKKQNDTFTENGLQVERESRSLVPSEQTQTTSIMGTPCMTSQADSIICVLDSLEPEIPNWDRAILKCRRKEPMVKRNDVVYSGRELSDASEISFIDEKGRSSRFIPVNYRPTFKDKSALPISTPEEKFRGQDIGETLLWEWAGLISSEVPHASLGEPSNSKFSIARIKHFPRELIFSKTSTLSFFESPIKGAFNSSKHVCFATKSGIGTFLGALNNFRSGGIPLRTQTQLVVLAQSLNEIPFFQDLLDISQSDKSVDVYFSVTKAPWKWPAGFSPLRHSDLRLLLPHDFDSSVFMSVFGDSNFAESLLESEGLIHQALGEAAFNTLKDRICVVRS